MPDAWEQWIGQLIDGRFLLLQYLGGTNNSAVFLTERRERGQVHKAAIKLLPVPSNNDERQFAQWRRAVKLSHPHLIRLFAMGRGKLGGEPLLYVVMEYADENVASVLPHRALAPAEAQVMLESTVDALTYLHEHGLVHGRIKPSNILADGDQVKISSDAILLAGETFDTQRGSGPYDAPEYGARNGSAPHVASPEGDVWSLALTLGEALTQSVFTDRQASTAEPEASLLEALREPFLEVVRNGLRWNPHDRWTLAQISSRIRVGAARTDSRAHVPEIPLKSPIRHEPRPLAPVQIQTYAAKWGRLAIPIATGIAFLVVIIAGARLFRHQPPPAQVPAASLQQPSSAAVRVSPPPTAENSRARKATQRNAPSPAAQTKVQRPEIPQPIPASARIERSSEDASPVPPAATPATGITPASVIEQAQPDVLPQARASIHGTVRVDVRVDVDPTGAVEGISLAAPGPSRYFARVALESARNWRFAPAMVAGRNVLSRWTLHYEFTRFGTNIKPKQDVP